MLLRKKRVEFFISTLHKTQWKKVILVKNIFLFQRHHLGQKVNKEGQGLLLQNFFCRVVYRILIFILNALYPKHILHGNLPLFFNIDVGPTCPRQKSILFFLHFLIYIYITKDKCPKVFEIQMYMMKKYPKMWEKKKHYPCLTKKLCSTRLNNLLCFTEV